MRSDKLPVASRIGRHLVRMARDQADAQQLHGQQQVQTLRAIERGYRQCGERWAARAVRDQIRRTRT
jgi:hypothetical protein